MLTLSEMLEQMTGGFKTMLAAIGSVIVAFIFKDACDQLLLPQFIVESLTPYMTAGLPPPWYSSPGRRWRSLPTSSP